MTYKDAERVLVAYIDTIDRESEFSEAIEKAVQALQKMDRPKRVSHVRCSCGGRGELWFKPLNGDMYKLVKCCECGKKAEGSRTEDGAWRAWKELNYGKDMC